ncbi:MAG: DUF645 family protein [Bacteroidales bacterium]|nr:DUF645 family protein [Bacteroidales bacterium]
MLRCRITVIWLSLQRGLNRQGTLLPR